MTSASHSELVGLLGRARKQIAAPVATPRASFISASSSCRSSVSGTSSTPTPRQRALCAYITKVGAGITRKLGSEGRPASAVNSKEMTSSLPLPSTTRSGSQPCARPSSSRSARPELSG